MVGFEKEMRMKIKEINEQLKTQHKSINNAISKLEAKDERDEELIGLLKDLRGETYKEAVLEKKKTGYFHA